MLLLAGLRRASARRLLHIFSHYVRSGQDVMNLENARELKSVVVGELDRETMLGGARTLRMGLPAQRIDTLGCVQPTMAVGIVRKGKTDYHLAVRVQRRQMLSSPLLEKLRQRARREIDVRYVGRVEKRSAVAAP